MRDFLFEIYTEEMPARLLNGVTLQLKELAEKNLSESTLKHGEIKAFSTPRRLVLFVKNVEEKEEDRVLEIKGPSHKIAYDEQGNATLVLKKFLEANNLKEDEIKIKEIKDSKYVFGYKRIEGRNAKDVLREVVLSSLKSLTFPRGMRWNNSNVVFLRPIRNFLSLFGDEIVNVEYAGIKSSNKSFGFYFDSPFEFNCESPVDYFTKVRERYIVLDYKERENIIRKGVEKISASVGGKVKFEEEFLEEVVNLTEFPTPFLCELKLEKFDIPDCIIESVIKDHLKSFPIYSKDFKKVLPYFIGIRNGTSDFIENVKKGYEKVATARLYDGAFFFEEDKKERLETRVPKLKDIVFISGLGTLFDKTERLVRIADYLGELLRLDPNEVALLKRACFLSKADITTQVVKEFPELQGTMGGIYAKIQGEREEVANAISEQYLPKFSGDELPITKLGKYLSIIDKLDTLVLSIGKGIEFTSSKDPFGLRRSALGIVQIAFTLDENVFPISDLINFILSLNAFNKENSSIQSEVLSLIRERANYLIRSNNISYDIANAVTTLPIDLMPTFLERAKTLEKYSKDEKFKEIVTVHKRIRNILQKATVESEFISENLLIEEAEKELYTVTNESEKLLNEMLKSRDYDAVIHLLYLYVPSVNKFFDKVLVMDKDERIRNNRLAQLSKVLKLFENFAMFSEVVIEKY
ncbi:glycine--tRNA ligase subunit beta [Caldisericum exile]|uniref:Glycine--tRNA ligase beta subunit n=1 Tax=Caldisericum exile (strain DSM 21853 / NBRC 104410 / AZM16c01) TaxID=511051 RepID=A0A7U6JEQ1_CALEA|nr:glycine--tRNA ligase subunit beta [Caldisericum exile]BAL80961.1 glycyl-tRNA synthetase beta subunit [Caldisericum exile AZM16c01]